MSNLSKARASTLNKILLGMARCGGGGCTRSQLAEMAGLKKSPYLLELLDFLENGNWIEKYLNPNPAKGWMYRPTQKLIDHWKQR